MNTIRLFERDDVSFNTNGIGNLTKHVISATVTEEVNGEFFMELTYPCNGNHYEELEIGKIIVTKAFPYGNPQAFRIARISLPIDGSVSITANHISYDLTKIVLKAPPIPQASTPDVSGSFPDSVTAMNWIKAENTIPSIRNFTFQEDIHITERLDMPVPMSVKAFLGGDADNSLLNMYGGEFIFDNFNVRHVASRGNDNGVTIRYGKNLTDFTQDVDCTETFTGLYPYYQSDQDGFIDGTVQYVLDEQGQKAYDYDEVQCLDCTSVDWTEEGYTNHTEEDGTKTWRGMPTRDMLTAYARKYIDKYGVNVGEESVTISFIELSKMSEYEHLKDLEKVELGDIVKVVYPMATLAVESECVKTEYDAVTDRYVSITLGERPQSFADTFVEASNSIADNAEQSQDLYIRFEKTAWGLESEVARAKGTENELSTKITQTETAIRTEAINRQNGDQSVLEQTASQIQSEVTRATESEGSLSSRITQNATSISSKVSQTDYNGKTIASLINQTADSVKIKANHVELDGNVVMKNDLVDGSTRISGSNIKTGKINASYIDADDIVVSKLHSTASSGTGDVYIENGKIYNSKTGHAVHISGNVGFTGSTAIGDTLWLGYSAPSHAATGLTIYTAPNIDAPGLVTNKNRIQIQTEWTGSSLNFYAGGTLVATLPNHFTGSTSS